MSVVTELVRDLELWKPQREGLEAIDRIITTSPVGKGIAKRQTLGQMMAADALAPYVVQQELFDVQEEFNPQIGTEFPSFCFAIATGGGKTRLMGACIAYLYLTKGFKNFFILSKGQTIYDKHRQDDFAPASPKYVFKGLTHFPSPRLIDGDNYEQSAYPQLFADDLTLYIFNIEKIFNERTDVEFRFHHFQETIGGSFADVLRDKPDLVFLMDESHNVRAEKSLRAINALLPILGLEFTATPKAHNVIYSYSLNQAINDGLVKRPVVLTRSDDDSLKEEKEDIKLGDGLRRHERKKTILESYCVNNDLPLVRPRVLISTKDIADCDRIGEKLESGDFLEGRYKGKVLSIHSGSEDEQIEKLLNLEKVENPYEIVVHVNKLKEGWDVKTIYTIIPLRASASEVLVEQTIGRGLRLPFGKPVSRGEDLDEQERNELLDLDTLEIISHESYSKVLEARKKAGDDWSAIEVAVEKRESPLESVEIKPDGDACYGLKIPRIQAKFHTDAEIDLANIEPKWDQLQDVEIRLRGIDLATLEERDYERIVEKHQGSLVNYFVRVLLQNSDEFDIRDKSKLQQFVRAYLDKVQVAADKKQDALFKHRGPIVADMLEQIQNRIKDQTRIEYTASDESIEFRAYRKNVPKGEKEKDKKAALEDELRGNIISGYAKTLFPRNVFDSKQEKWLADILDDDKEVQRWLRLPQRQMAIPYKEGNYNPDFIAEGKGNRFYLLEVKDESKVEEALRAPDTHEVALKYRAALAWCQAMNKATKHKWEYKLIPSNAITTTQSFNGVISNAVKLS